MAMGLENAALHADAKEQVRQLSLLGEMGRTLAGSLDPDQVLAVGTDAACRLLATDRAFVVLHDPVHGGLRVAAATGPLAKELLTRFHPTLERSGIYRKVLQERRVVAIEDMDAYPDADPIAKELASRSLLAAPLLSRGEVSGVLYIDDCRHKRRFTEAEQERLMTVAGRLALAIENARLYAEARGRLSELSTVIDVARVISSTLDLQKVLTAGAEHLKETLRAEACTILLEERDGQVLRRAAYRGHPVGAEVLPRDPPTLAWEALAARSPVTGSLGEEQADPPVLAVPLHVRDQSVGVALVASGKRERAFTRDELSLVTAIASQLAVAVDHARLYQEARRRAEELSLLHEVGRSLVASLDIETVLEAGVRNLARMVDAPTAALALALPDGTALEIRAVWGGPRKIIGRRLPALPPGFLIGLAVSRREPILVEDALTDPRVRQDLRAEFGGRAYLVLPLLVRDRYIGSALIAERQHPRRFTPAEVDRAAAVANQLAVAVENARLYEDLRRSYDQLARAQEQLIHRERLAALGELSAVVAHEVRNPLGVIFNSLGSLRRLLRPEGDARLLLDIVGEEADRLNRIVGDLLDFAKPMTPVLRPEPLEQVVDQALASTVGDSDVEVVREFDPNLPPVALDAHLFHQALVNVAANAVQAMPKGGRIFVRLRRDAGGVLLEVEDTGPGIPEEIRSRIFEPFFTTKATGTGLGLAVVKRIVQGHGGDISVGSLTGCGARVQIRLPVAIRTPSPIESGGGLG
jgi:signal transduction histidine kinase